MICGFKLKQLIYSCVLLMTFVPVMAVKMFYCLPDTQYHLLYPDDDEKAHEKAAEAQNNNPIFHIHISSFVLSDECFVPLPFYRVLHKRLYCQILRIFAPSRHCFLRAPPLL